MTKTYSRVEKVAILFLGLGKELAGELVKHLPQKDIIAVSQAMNRLGSVSTDEVDSVCQEFSQLLIKHEPTVDVRRFVEKVFGPEAVAPVPDLSVAGLPKKTIERIAKDLAKETFSTAAVVLSLFDTASQARLISLLDRAFATSLLQQVAQETSVDHSILGDVREDVMRKINEPSHVVGGVETVIALFKHMDSASRSRELDALYDRDPDLAAQVQAGLRNFDDLLQFPDEDIQVLLSKIERDQLALALRGGSEEVLTKIMQLVSARVADDLKERISSGKPQPVRDVEAARNEIMNLADKLEEEGVISLEPRV